MILRLVFGGSYPKDASAADENEDRFAVNPLAGRFAVSDGASRSYDSKTWAGELVRRFMEPAPITPEWVNTAARQVAGNVDFASLPWYSQGGIAEGSFASLLGAEWVSYRCEADIFCVGDSLALLADENGIVKTWPYSKPVQFDADPVLLSTRTDANAFIGMGNFYHTHTTSWPVAEGQSIFLMTDAIGRWALEQDANGFNPIATLREIESIDQLASFVEAARSSGSMRMDDSTLIQLKAENTQS